MRLVIVLALTLLGVNATWAQDEATAPRTPPTADTTRPTDPDPDEFIPAATDPGVDYAELQRRVKYPDEARKRGVQGTVVLRVLISETGKPLRYRIDQTSSTLLTEGAIDAVMSLTYTPAMQEGRATRSWVTIPIKFTLY